ncbi:purine-binding chemotaxis protein CheW [Pseudomonas sp. ABC1]|uniref:chemotaxis protein CheW n=1 Tax=Pseudomonas sp. ABC1 TaxID=2748080 RepID=UPI0015C37C2A|nr:chemotaxis protein CheW [Pseudomonas sp. ABC1]QLF93798.1 purine-binding chemotaxis protein CheW [Pseudomonas sp. ABC1]
MSSAGTSTTSVAGGLYLLFQLGEDRYALDVHEVVEVLPLRRLKQVPEAPPWVAGVFEHRRRVIPVLDMSQRVLKRPAHVRNSTRLVLVRFDGRLGEASPVLGLILEHATDTLRLSPDAFQASGLEGGQAAYLGPVQPSAQGLIQRIEVASLLDDALRALLFQPAEQGATR